MNATSITVTSVTKDSPGAGQITIVGTYSTVDYTQPATQVTVGEFPEGNSAWSRGHRLTNAAHFCMRNGVTPAAITVGSLAKIAQALVPGLTWVPSITTEPVDDSCVASSTAADFTVVASSEQTPTYQWQYETKASAVLTWDNSVNVSDGATVTLGNKVYTFKTALTPTEGQVLIGANGDASLLNLIRAINHTGTPDTDYKCAAAHTQFAAEPAVGSHAITVRALVSGTAANAYATTETAAVLSWGGSVAAGGGTWTSASGTVNGCAYTNDTTATLTATPTTTMQSGTEHRCVVTNTAGTDTSTSATLTIT